MSNSSFFLNGSLHNFGFLEPAGTSCLEHSVQLLYTVNVSSRGLLAVWGWFIKCNLHKIAALSGLFKFLYAIKVYLNLNQIFLKVIFKDFF